ncbi:MAG: helix-turn-helix domain-containing protein [Lachnospiraceae bacterium]|nr:helix-turn-helix domain-containing protein [Lachnospiraceae bacterium]
MNYYENLNHGTGGFPIGIHDTICEKGFYLYPHIHREFEFLVMKKGTGKMYIDGAECNIKVGDAIFINSEELHVGINVDEEEAEFFAVVFAPEMFGNFGDDEIMNKYVLPVLNKRKTLPRMYCSGVEWQDGVLGLLDEIHVAYSLAEVGFELKIKSLLMQIWQICFVHGEQEQENGNQGRTIEDMKKVFLYIQNEYASPLSLEDMASKVNMSREYFCRRFSELMHMTPFEYLLRVRIENSCRMLLDDNLTIGEVATQCGFNSFSYFSKVFRRFVGCTPREYRTSMTMER